MPSLLLFFSSSSLQFNSPRFSNFRLPRYLAYGGSSLGPLFLTVTLTSFVFYTSLLTSSSCHHRSYPSSTALFPPPSFVMLVLRAGTVTLAPVHAGISNPCAHLLAFCLSLVGLTLFSPLLVPGVMLWNSLLQDIVEAESPFWFTEQQLDKFMEKKSPKVIQTGTHS